MEDLIINNLLAMLSKYLPHIYSLYNSNNKKIIHLATLGKKTLEKRDNKYKAEGPFSAETTIWELLTFVEFDKNYNILNWLNTIDKMILELCQKLDYSHIRQIRKICDSMLSCNSEKKSEYRRHLSEIATIWKLTNQEGIDLKQVEEKLPNGKSIDFSLLENGKTSLIEIYNIDFMIERLNSNKNVHDFLYKRIYDKMCAKSANLDEEYKGTIYLVVVLWGEFVNLMEYEIAINKILDDFPYVFLMTFVKYIDRSGYTSYEFENLKIVFEKLMKVKTNTQ